MNYTCAFCGKGHPTRLHYRYGSRKFTKVARKAGYGFVKEAKKNNIFKKN